MKMQMFATLGKANPNTGNIRGINLAAVKHTTVQVTRPQVFSSRKYYWSESHGACRQDELNSGEPPVVK
jgi:hypothetical protein